MPQLTGGWFFVGFQVNGLGFRGFPLRVSGFRVQGLGVWGQVTDLGFRGFRLRIWVSDGISMVTGI